MQSEIEIANLLIVKNIARAALFPTRQNSRMVCILKQTVFFVSSGHFCLETSRNYPNFSSNKHAIFRKKIEWRGLRTLIL